MSQGVPLRRSHHEDREGWLSYWTSQRMPWRAQPEIDDERQRYLAARRTVRPDLDAGIYPFHDENGSIKLTRADVEWWLATPESNGLRGPVEWPENDHLHRKGLDLQGAHLERATLYLATLERAFLEQAHLHLHLHLITLYEAYLRGAYLFRAEMQGTCLTKARLEGAVLHEPHLGALSPRDDCATGCRATSYRAFVLPGVTQSRHRAPQSQSCKGPIS